MVKAIEPVNPLLKKHIDCFYLIDGWGEERFRYYAFPHINSGLSILSGGRVKREGEAIYFCESKDSEIQLELLGKYLHPVLVDYSGTFLELSIVFKPFGINRFFRDTYLSMAPRYTQPLASPVWKEFGKKFSFQEQDLPKLEEFLISQWAEIPEILRLEKAAPFLEDLQESISISELAKQLPLPEKTFVRHFKKHMGCTPSEYRRIFRFRASVAAKLIENPSKTFTEITHELGYFDQSYFIKEYKKMTRHNPKDFFKNTQRIDGQKLIYEIC